MSVLLPVLETEGRSAKELAGFTRGPATSGGTPPDTLRNTLPELLVWFQADGLTGPVEAAGIDGDEITPLVRVWVDVRWFRRVRAQGRVETAGSAGDQYVFKWWDGSAWQPLGSLLSSAGPVLPLHITGDIRGGWVSLDAAVIDSANTDVLLGMFYQGDPASLAATGNVVLRFEQAVTSNNGLPRRWRVKVLKTEGSAVANGVSLGELAFRTRSDGADLSTGGTAIADVNTSPFFAANAFNGTVGDSLDAWATSTDGPHWIGYDHVDGFMCGAVVMRPRAGHPEQAPIDFDVQWARIDTDARVDANWTTAWSIRGATGWADGATRVFVPGLAFSAWRVRIVGTQSNPSDAGGVSIGDMYFSYEGVNITAGGNPIESDHSYIGVCDLAFNGTRGDANDAWMTNTPGQHWIGYEFPDVVKVDAVWIGCRNGYPGQGPETIVVEARDASGVWHPVWDDEPNSLPIYLGALGSYLWSKYSLTAFIYPNSGF